MIGFGDYHYVYASGREGDWFRVGFSPRAQNITLYLSCGLKMFEEMLPTLGKYKTGKGCLYINRYEDIDPEALRKLIFQAYHEARPAHEG